ncbi:MAG: hypothetical protein Q9202_004293 [Teloschistes flavicans]
MSSPRLSAALLALYSAPSVLAVPVESASSSGLLLSRDTVALKPSNCSDPDEPVTPTCWTSLKVADYLNNWNKTTHICGSRDTNGVGCCVEEEPWTTCFIRLSTGYAGDSCDNLGGNYCQNVPKNLDEDLAPDDQAPAIYVLNAIYAIHSLFSNYDKALSAVNDSTIKEVLDVFSKDSSSSHVISLRYELPTALSLGLTIASQNTTNNNPITRDLSTLWTSALAAAPSVPRAIWPNDTDNSQTISITSIAISTSNQGTFLQSGLDLLMSDIPTFLAFTRAGLFANSTLNAIIPRLVSRAHDLAGGLNTFITSKFLQAYGIFATPSNNAIDDRSTFETQNRCTLNAASWCVSTRDRRSVYYWSPATHRQYQLRSKGATPITMPDLMRKITEAGWADAEVLFDGNFNCTARGNAGGRIVFVGEEDGVVDASCVSQLPMYLECGTACPTDVVVGEGKCPFGFDRGC